MGGHRMWGVGDGMLRGKNVLGLVDPKMGKAISSFENFGLVRDINQTCMVHMRKNKRHANSQGFWNETYPGYFPLPSKSTFYPFPYCSLPQESDL